jgi:hypothetical protein
MGYLFVEYTVHLINAQTAPSASNSGSVESYAGVPDTYQITTNKSSIDPLSAPQILDALPTSVVLQDNPTTLFNKKALLIDPGVYNITAYSLLEILDRTRATKDTELIIDLYNPVTL